MAIIGVAAIVGLFSERKMMKRHTVRFCLGLLGTLLLVGCSRDLAFTVRFQSIEGLRTGDRVLADTHAIGSVAAVVYGDQGDYRVDVRIAREHAENLGRQSIFFIDVDPRQPDRKALMVIARCPSRVKRTSSSTKPSLIVATSPRRTWVPSGRVTTGRSANSCPRSR